jgi:hypothetical protein
MKLRRLTVLASLASICTLGAASHASAATVGISDQQAGTFTNPLYAPLKLKVARYITPYDVLDDPDQKAKLEAWLTSAKAARQTTLVSFEHSRIAGKVATAPSVAAYTRQLRRIRSAYGRQINDVSPWNEVNVCQAPGRTEGQPRKICRSATGARLTARYYMAARKVFRGKKIVGLDILDGVNPGGAVSYIKRFKRFAKPLPTYWGIHNYSDTNRGSTSRTARLLKAIGSRKAQIWLTETGGQLRLRGRDVGAAKAARALRCMFSMPKKYKQIKRLYIYQFNGAPVTNDFDAGLINIDNTTRPGYDVVRKRQSSTCRP